MRGDWRLGMKWSRGGQTTARAIASLPSLFSPNAKNGFHIFKWLEKKKEQECVCNI